MLRPERMSRVSVTGSKKVIDDAIEAVHDLNLLHITDYGGDWAEFTPGNPLAGADRAAERLVTVRSLQSILGIEDEDAGPARIVTEEALDEELEEIRRRVNELDDRRDELRDELRAVEDRIDTMEPFGRLNIDLDLLSGYDSLSVSVGEGDPARVRDALDEAGVDDYRVFAEDGVLAVFARTDELDDILVGTEFAAYDVPDAEGTPSEYLSELEHERKQLQSKLRTVEDQLEEERYEVGGFLLAAEETLAIRVQRREAPLSFATTENAFVAEGWIPTSRVADLEDGLKREVGEHVDVDELEVAQYDGHGRIVEREDVGGAPGGRPTAAADGGNGGDGEEVATDGGTADAERGPHGATNLAPPVVQQNPGPVKPFETIVQVINRPRYSELDPTVVLFLTFPLFFGLMIGDLGYGILYIAIGWYIYSNFESEAIKSLGGVGIIAGVATAVFGILYGEVFGLHVLGDVVWGGHPPIHKGLQPHYEEYAFLWLVISVLLGLLHLTVGYAFDFYEHLDHGFTGAMLHSGSWILMLVGLWAFIFSDVLRGTAPEFMVGPQSVFNGNPLALGFTGFPEPVGYLGLAVFAVGLVLLVYGEPIEGVEALNVLVNGLSYTRLAAVLLAKAGMAFVVNLLVFGAYEHDGEWHFIFPEHSLAYAEEHGEVVFAGLMTGTGTFEVIVGGLVGILILVVGHALVLVLGVTSAGLQAVRLEYVEFFGKFFEGGGEAYEPFGYERTYTTEE